MEGNDVQLIVTERQLESMVKRLVERQTQKLIEQVHKHQEQVQSLVCQLNVTQIEKKELHGQIKKYKAEIEACHSRMREVVAETKHLTAGADVALDALMRNTKGQSWLSVAGKLQEILKLENEFSRRVALRVQQLVMTGEWECLSVNAGGSTETKQVMVFETKSSMPGVGATIDLLLRASWLVFLNNPTRCIMNELIIKRIREFPQALSIVDEIYNSPFAAVLGSLQVKANQQERHIGTCLALMQLVTTVYAYDNGAKSPHKERPYRLGECRIVLPYDGFYNMQYFYWNFSADTWATAAGHLNMIAWVRAFRPQSLTPQPHARHLSNFP